MCYNHNLHAKGIRSRLTQRRQAFIKISENTWCKCLGQLKWWANKAITETFSVFPANERTHSPCLTLWWIVPRCDTSILKLHKPLHKSLRGTSKPSAHPPVFARKERNVYIYWPNGSIMSPWCAACDSQMRWKRDAAINGLLSSVALSSQSSPRSSRQITTNFWKNKHGESHVTCQEHVWLMFQPIIKRKKKLSRTLYCYIILYEYMYYLYYIIWINLKDKGFFFL